MHLSKKRRLRLDGLMFEDEKNCLVIIQIQLFLYLYNKCHLFYTINVILLFLFYREYYNISYLFL